MHTRCYLLNDACACLRVFDSNVPQYFAAHERDEFAAFLQHPDRGDDYLVIERDQRIVACGGVSMKDQHTAVFCWGMVDSNLHRQGLGKALAHARLQHVNALRARRIELSTSQHSGGFYRTLGFVVTRVTADGHGPGLHAIHMQRTQAPR